MGEGAIKNDDPAIGILDFACHLFVIGHWDFAFFVADRLYQVETVGD